MIGPINWNYVPAAFAFAGGASWTWCALAALDGAELPRAVLVGASAICAAVLFREGFARIKLASSRWTPAEEAVVLADLELWHARYRLGALDAHGKAAAKLYGTAEQIERVRTKLDNAFPGLRAKGWRPSPPPPSADDSEEA